MESENQKPNIQKDGFSDESKKLNYLLNDSLAIFVHNNCCT